MGYNSVRKHCFKYEKVLTNILKCLFVSEHYVLLAVLHNGS